MEAVATWEKIAIGIVVLVLLLWWRPGMKAMFEQSRQAENKDWKGVLIPVGLVVLFVIFLLSTV
ncbi:MAG: hypothetical protein GXP10_07750 [Gammaproteobacteria bacterium]|nr:hypothetical protein [Gammaproteobacteria bacterium]